MTESYFNSENSAHGGCLLLLCFKALTHVHHVTSVVKDGDLAVVLYLGGQIKLGAQSYQELEKKPF